MPVKVFWFGNMEEVVYNGDDIILNPLFNFELMKGLEHLGDARMFGSASNGTCKSILNMLKALNLSDDHGKGSCSSRGVNGRGQWLLW